MTSLDDLVTLVMLVLCFSLAVLVAYLISKVNELESKTSSLLQSNQTHKRPSNDIFGGLQGKPLWDAWQVAVSTSVDEFGLDRDRDRLIMLLELHVRELVRAGKAIGLAPSAENFPGDTVVLRHYEACSSHSFIIHGKLLSCGKKISSASSDEERVQVITELETISRRLGAMVLADEEFSNHCIAL